MGSNPTGPIGNFRRPCGTIRLVNLERLTSKKMRNKKVFLIAMAVLVVFGLLPTKAQTQIAGISLPPIGSVAIAKVNGGTTAKLGAGDSITIYIKDEQGDPYPSVVNGEDENGLLVANEIVFEVELVKGDGQLVKSDSQSFPFVALMGSNPFEISIPVEVIRADPYCAVSYPSAQCQDENKKKNPALNNPLTPGPVFLKSIYAKSNVHRLPSGESVGEIQSPVKSLNFELFTVGSPPRIASDKTAVKFSETVTLTGANFDDTNITPERTQVSIHFDYASANTAGGYAESRVINSVFVDDEDLIHYCGPTKIKFEVPEAIPIPPSPVPGGLLYTTYKPMPLGRHTITLSNEYGLSNTINIDLSGGKGVPDDDPACANPSGTITSIEPTSGPVGTILTINGSGFGAAARYGGQLFSWNHVYINGHNQFDAPEAPVVDFQYQEYIGEDGFKKVNVTQLKVKVPERATTGPVRVVPGTRYTITGPVFTVTPGRAADGGGGNGGGGGGGGGNGGGGGGTGALNINTVAPQVLNVESQNTVILEGQGFSTSVLFGSDNPALSFSEAEVSDDGKVLRVEVDVGTVDPAEQEQGAQIILSTTEGDFASISVGLAVKNPEAPEVTSVEVTPSAEEDQVTLIINGRNFTEDSEVVLYGLPTAVLSGFEIDSLTQITAQVTVLDFDPNIFGFIRRAYAAPPLGDSPGGLAVITKKGASNVAGVNSAQLANPSNPVTYNSNLPKVEETGFEDICSKKVGLATCVQRLYLLSLGLGSIVALLMIILAGYSYMTAQGNAQQVEKAKEGFASAFIGLIVLFIAFILLYVINPDLVQFNREIEFGGGAPGAPSSSRQPTSTTP